MDSTSVMNVSSIENDPAWRAAWVGIAERTYKLDHATAQRVVFARWLAETGRLTDRLLPTPQ
jgi:hypothetical protein